MLCCRSWSRPRGVEIEMRLFSSWSVETRHSVIRTFVHSPLTASQQFAARVGGRSVRVALGQVVYVLG